MLQPNNLGHCSKTQQHVRNVDHPQIKSNGITWIFRTSRVVNTMTVTIPLFYVFFDISFFSGFDIYITFRLSRMAKFRGFEMSPFLDPFNSVKAPFASQFIFQHQESNNLYF